MQVREVGHRTWRKAWPLFYRVRGMGNTQPPHLWANYLDFLAQKVITEDCMRPLSCFSASIISCCTLFFTLFMTFSAISNRPLSFVDYLFLRRKLFCGGVSSNSGNLCRTNSSLLRSASCPKRINNLTAR